MRNQVTHHPPRERGIVLMAALLFALVVMAFAVSVVTSGVAVNSQNRYLVAQQRAHDAAEAGVHHLITALNGPMGKAIVAAAQLEGTLQGDIGSGQRIRYRVTLAPAGADGADNDLDGAIDEPDEADMFEVTSTGFADRVARTVRVTLQAVYRTPESTAATYVADPMATLRFNGNSFLISGKDVDMDGNPTGVLVPGVGVNGEPAPFLAALSNNIKDNIVGLGGTASVYKVEGIDFKPLIEDAIRAANVRLSADSTVKPANPGDWGTLASPAILYGRGDIHISGGAEGAGILIVDGNLKITGGFEWRGLIIVRGTVNFSGGGGGKRLIGALVVEKDVLGEADVTADDLTVSGTIDILYSLQTLARVSQAFASFTIVNWREGPNPEEVSS